MKAGTKMWMAAALGLAGLSALPAFAQDVGAGITAWEAGRHEEAVRIWRPLADAGNADAQFNLAQAYRLGRGVPQNNGLSEQFYERAARQGHEQAEANLGLILFQNGRRREAMPWIQRAAERGDARAQYVYGTALFNGDNVPRDLSRAYAFMRRSAAQGLPPARTQLEEIERNITAADRQRGDTLAQQLEQNAARLAANTAVPERPATRPARPAPVERAEVPASAPARTPARTLERPAAPVRVAERAPAATPPRRVEPAAPAERPTAAAGRWRVQLGAFSSEANARRAWEAQGRLVAGFSALQPYLVRAGALTRLQAGPLPNRAAAERACASARSASLPCFAVES